MRTISLLYFAGLLAAQDHVGKPLPDYVTGDECLFCHDRNVGITWQTNPHAWTIRPVGIDPPVANPQQGATHVLGSGPRARWLKLAGYGRFDLVGSTGDFAARCVGCHTTGIDPKTRAFSNFALDCYTCHGVVPGAHSGDASLVWLSKKNRPARQVVAICGQCHLRGGKSRSTGLPFPNNFVPGDDLFTDFRITDPIEAADGHIYQNVKAVLRGATQTCLTCHQIHTKHDPGKLTVAPTCQMYGGL